MLITIEVEKDPLYKEGLKKGLEQGLEEAKKEDVVKLYTRLKLQPEEISKVLDLPLEKVQKWLKEEGLI